MSKSPLSENWLKPVKTTPKWKQTPEWRRQVKDVLFLVAKGFDVDKINAITQIDHMAIRRIMDEEEENNEIIRKSWGSKIPVMRDIVGMGLNGIRETLKEMLDPEVRREMIKNAGDLATITKVVESLNLLLRLEEGKSTANQAVQHNHTFQETRHVLQELQKVDPVFEYPVAITDAKPVELEPVVIDEPVPVLVENGSE